MSDTTLFPNQVTFVCGAHMDQIMRLESSSISGVSNPARLEIYPGGAALNSASIAAALGLDAHLLSPIGDDVNGHYLVDICNERGIRPALIAEQKFPTGLYSAIFEPDGDILIGASDLSIYDVFDLDWIARHLAPSKALFINSNLDEAVLGVLCEKADHIAAASISPAKAKRLLPILGKIDILFTNATEANVMTGVSVSDTNAQAEWFIDQGVGSGTISNGSDPLVFWHEGSVQSLPVETVSKIIDVNGAGDALAGGVLAGMGSGFTFEKSVKLGLKTAVSSLGHKGPYKSVSYYKNLKANL